MLLKRTITLAMLMAATAVAANAAKMKPVVVTIHTADGKDAGTVTLRPGKSGAVNVKVDVKNLPPGQHGIHIHQYAKCDPPDFKTAGPHFNPENKQHGALNPMGHHAGDLPQNVTIGEGHVGHATFKIDYLSLDPASPNSIIANGGTSIVVHEKLDDMKTDPSGNSGNRIACGVITSPTP